MRRPRIAVVSAMLALLAAVPGALAQQRIEGDGHLFLPGTKARVVAVPFVEDKGEKIAKYIDAKAGKL